MSKYKGDVTEGEGLALFFTVSPLVGLLVGVLFSAIVGDKDTAQQMAITFLGFIAFWAIAWIGYAGGRAAQRKRDRY